MDATTAIGSVLAAFGLSGAAGLNAWLPLLIGAAASRLGIVDLGEPFGDLGSTTGLVVLASLTTLDFVGDKVPVIDSVLHTVGIGVAPAAGAALFTGETAIGTDIPQGVSIALGALTAGSVHGVRAAIRPASTATTAGVGNPILSLLEDIASVGTTVLAFAVPVLAVLLLLAMLGTAVWVWRRVHRGRPAVE